MTVCNQCKVDYIPYAQDKNDMEAVAALFICSDCFNKAWRKFVKMRNKRQNLESAGIHPKIAGKIAFNQ